MQNDINFLDSKIYFLLYNISVNRQVIVLVFLFLEAFRLLPSPVVASLMGASINVKHKKIIKSNK